MEHITVDSGKYTLDWAEQLGRILAIRHIYLN